MKHSLSKPKTFEQDIQGLRNPQIGAIYASLAHWTHSNKVATVVMPTGTGKTETMLSLLLLVRCSKLLVVVPTDPLREQIADKFIGLGLLKKFGLLKQEAHNPVVGILKKRLSDADEAKKFIDSCNVIVTTASYLARMDEAVFKVLVSESSHVFIDEAHHSEAETWFSIREAFQGKRIIQFTATPYRNDGKKSRAEIIYCFPLKNAQREGYFKKIEFHPVYEWEKGEEDVAIANKAVEILRKDREDYPHILLARVETKRRADEIFEIYSKFTDLKVAKIYSGLSGKESIKKAIANKEYQVVVCVDMLGEGFDLPELKIAAFHDVKRAFLQLFNSLGDLHAQSMMKS
ncbi:MAG: DEAD/DEAH box helicase family protein [Acidobacteria bacterium]|nr:DEAD/DEAH box helicase family protein [Acidobacteriota bacterium]